MEAEEGQAMNVIVQVQTEEYDPYAEVLKNMVEQQIPGSTVKGSCERFEAVVSEIIGTKRHRYGPMPSPEAQVKIRSCVREHMEADLPVPVLVPWGCSKQGPFEMDLAEVMAFKQLNCLLERVRSHYAPGLEMVIRLEDITDMVLLPSHEKKTQLYRTSMIQLMRLMANDGIEISLESDLMLKGAVLDRVSELSPIVLQSFHVPALSGKRGVFLRSHLPGWSGDLPDDQVEYYRKAYARFYPSNSHLENDELLARYFALSFVKHSLKGTGAKSEWESHISVSFVGIPWGANGARVQMRTIPETYTSNHKAPWLGKGYARIDGRDVTPAIAGWDGDGLEYHPASLRISDEHESLSVQCDYVVLS